MSHIFISYKHEDKIYLDRLVGWLHENKIANHEIWYDNHIEAGNSWRVEIDSALNEAFLVLAIVTTKSAQSQYCTYEWAYAMGQGIPILPLIFEEINITTGILAPLASKQIVNCKENFPSYLSEQVRRFKSVPPQIAAINKIIYDTIYDTHRRFFILGWLGEELKDFEEEVRERVMAYFIQKASEAYQILENLMVDKAFILSGKQYRLCWQLVDFLAELSDLDEKYEEYLQERLFPLFDSVWLPAFEYFEYDGWWTKWVGSHFRRDLENEHTRIEVFTEITRAFEIFNPEDVNMFIHNKINRQKHKQQLSDDGAS